MRSPSFREFAALMKMEVWELTYRLKGVWLKFILSLPKLPNHAVSLLHTIIHGPLSLGDSHKTTFQPIPCITCALPSLPVQCQLSPTSLWILLQWTDSGFCYFFQTLHFAIIIDSHVIVRPSGEMSSILFTQFPSVIHSIESQMGCWYWNTSPAFFKIHQFHMHSCLCVCMPAQAYVSMRVCISSQATLSHV